MNKILLFCISLLLVGCDKFETAPLEGSVDRSGRVIATKVYFYDSVSDVHDKYREIHGLSSTAKVEVIGFARWPEYRDDKGAPVSDEGQPLTCEIHTTRPQKINDDATLTLGHEMLHCVIGTYHPENKH